MRRIFIFSLALLLLTSLCGCGGQPVETQPTSTQAATPNTTNPTQNTKPHISQQSMLAASMPIITQNFTADDGEVLVQHIYQNLELIVPDQDVADAVIIDYLNRTDKWHTTAEELYTDANATYEAENHLGTFLFQTTFAPTRLDRGIFSLFGNTVTHKGHSHPEVTAESVTYDLTTGEALTISDILQPNANLQTLRAHVISALQEQEDVITLYEGYENTVTEQFENLSNWYFSDSGLVFYYSPYEIAPYSSGVITAEIEYNKLSSILNDAFFPGESDEFNGQLFVAPLDIDNMSQFTQIAEVICSQDSKQYILYTDGLLENLRIAQLKDNTEYTVFAAQYVSPGDGITVYAAENDIFNIRYTANGVAVTKTLRFTADGTPQLTD